MKKKISRKQKIKVINYVFENGFNKYIFIEPFVRVFIEDLHHKGMYTHEGVSYTKNEVYDLEKKINELNKFLNEKKICLYERHNQVIIVEYKSGKTIL